MTDNLILIAVRSDRDDVGLPVRGILDALGNRTAPAHVTAFEVPGISPRQLDLMRELFTDGNPAAFQTVAGCEIGGGS